MDIGAVAEVKDWPEEEIVFEFNRNKRVHNQFIIKADLCSLIFKKYDYKAVK